MSIRFPEVCRDSSTPYTDATSWYISQVGRHTFHQMTRTPRSSTECAPIGLENRVKRPMNAFMIWSQIQRRSITATSPGLHNAVISKELGRQWNSLSPNEQQPYIDESLRLRRFHMLEYPDYKYRPKRRSTTSSYKMSAASVVVSRRLARPKLCGTQLQRRRVRLSRNSCCSSSSESYASSTPSNDDNGLFNTSVPSCDSGEEDDGYDDKDDLMSMSNNVRRRNAVPSTDSEPLTLGLRMVDMTHNYEEMSMNNDAVYCCDINADYYSTPEVDALLADDWLFNCYDSSDR